VGDLPGTGLILPSMTHDLPPHCSDPDCLKGVLFARCRRCGFLVWQGGSCPASADEDTHLTHLVGITADKFDREALRDGIRKIREHLGE
jgi:hypothetical protein